MPRLEDSHNEIVSQVRQDRLRKQQELSQKRHRSERHDRAFVRGALRRGVPKPEIEGLLLRATEVHRLDPERDPIAYVRGLIHEEGSSLGSMRPTETPAADSATRPRTSPSNPEPLRKEHAGPSEAIARRYIQENFEPTDWLAVVVRNRDTHETVQRITTAQHIAGGEFQSWLRHKNANGSDIYLSLNTLKEHAHGRTKADVKDIRHLYLDLDEEGQRKLATIYEDAAVPHPNYVLQTSPDKYQVVWRVEAMPQAEAEDLLRGLVQRFGGDPAATDATRVFRLPGFNNKKYEHDFPVKLTAGTLSEPVYQGQDFKIEPVPRLPGTAPRPNLATTPALGNTQSERDWAYAIRHLRGGDKPEAIIREIASYRARDRYGSQDATKLVGPKKANPRYYAEHTVARAMAHLGMTGRFDENENRSPDSEPNR